MRHVSIRAGFLASAWLWPPILLWASEPPAVELAVPLAFVRIHCAACHDSAEPEGDFRLANLGVDLADAPTHVAWSRVLARVQSGEMPPPGDADRPDEPAIRSFLTELRSAFHAELVERTKDDGRVRTRRLNRLEYENTVHDLLAIDAPLQDLLPEDDLRHGFSNQTEALSISPVHIQHYMAAADRAIEAASVRRPRPETKTHRFAFDHDAEKPWSAYLHNRLQ